MVEVEESMDNRNDAKKPPVLNKFVVDVIAFFQDEVQQRPQKRPDFVKMRNEEVFVWGIS